MKVVEINEYSPEVLSALNELIPLLSSSAIQLQKPILLNLIMSDSAHLLMAVEDGKFYGTLTLVTFSIPAGTRAWIEDVVVDDKARGNGVGRLLSEHAVILAQELGAKTIDLTSRPSRVAANELYKSIGFELRDTNVYRYNNA